MSSEPPPYSRVDPLRSSQVYDASKVSVAVMGATGSGKSTFINLVSCSQLPVSRDLQSCTQRVELALDFQLDGRTVCLIDTPGFDDTEKSDTDILKNITAFLAEQYKGGTLLHGIVYLHRISDNRMGGVSTRSFRLFRKLCGSDSLKNVIIVTNMWSKVEEEEGSERERQLRSDSRFFKPALDDHARMLRHCDTLESAQNIIRAVFDNHPVALDVQVDLVDRGKDIKETQVGMELSTQLDTLIVKHNKEIDTIKADLKEQSMHSSNEKDIKELEDALKKTEAERDRIMWEAMNMSMIFAREQVKMRQELQEMRARLIAIEMRRDRNRSSGHFIPSAGVQNPLPPGQNTSRPPVAPAVTFSVSEPPALPSHRTSLDRSKLDPFDNVRMATRPRDAPAPPVSDRGTGAPAKQVSNVERLPSKSTMHQSDVQYSPFTSTNNEGGAGHPSSEHRFSASFLLGGSDTKLADTGDSDSRDLSSSVFGNKQAVNAPSPFILANTLKPSQDSLSINKAGFGAAASSIANQDRRSVKPTSNTSDSSTTSNSGFPSPVPLPRSHDRPTDIVSDQLGPSNTISPVPVLHRPDPPPLPESPATESPVLSASPPSDESPHQIVNPSDSLIPVTEDVDDAEHPCVSTPDHDLSLLSLSDSPLLPAFGKLSSPEDLETSESASDFPESPKLSPLVEVAPSHDVLLSIQPSIVPPVTPQASHVPAHPSQPERPVFASRPLPAVPMQPGLEARPLHADTLPPVSVATAALALRHYATFPNNQGGVSNVSTGAKKHFRTAEEQNQVAQTPLPTSHTSPATKESRGGSK